jgi:hypothetical protein
MGTLNGKKTLIGLATLVVGASEFSEYITDEETALIIDSVLKIIGLTMTVIGGVHKIYKAYKAK